MFRRVRLAAWLLALGIGLLALSTPAGAENGRVVVVPLQGVINPVASAYLDRALTEAEASGARAVVIELDTPGGLDSSMREMIQRIHSARVPVVVYVGPAGARAASAGVFITYAAHVAAMAPNTNIGSAHPVAIGQGGEEAMSPDMRAKVENDAVAYIRGLAEERGRNADWAEQAVRQSVNVTASQAKDLGVVDLLAPDLPSLLQQIQGRSVTLASGPVMLDTAGAAIERTDLNPIERFLYTISNPDLAYLLLTLGMLGIVYELANPGAILPGVVGGIALLLAFLSLGTLPVNYVGVALIVLAFGLFLADLYTPTHGALTVGGIISLLLGSLVLFNAGGPLMQLSLWVIAGVVGSVSLFAIFAMGAAWRALHRQVAFGREALPGQLATVRQALTPQGMVFLHGELWSAVTDGAQVPVGQQVRVVKLEGLTLHVVPLDPRSDDVRIVPTRDRPAA